MSEGWPPGSAADPGWASAPADQYTQDGRLFGCCQRSFARRMTDLAAVSDLEVRVGSEIEWFLGREDRGTLIPAHTGPGYVHRRAGRRAETFGGLDPDAIAAAHRWLY